MLKYGETGVILPLNDYIENSMPNLKAEMDKRDGVEKALTYSDGNIYYLPMLDETPSGNIPYIVRTDWLYQLGLERPVTIEDPFRRLHQPLVPDRRLLGAGDSGTAVHGGHRRMNGRFPGFRELVYAN